MNRRELVFKYLILTVSYLAFAILFWPFKTALLLAMLFAMAMAPLLNKWLVKIKNEKLLIFLMVTGFILIIVAPLTMIVSKGILNLSQLQQDTITQMPVYKNIEETLMKAINYLSEISSRFNVDLREDLDIQSQLPRALSAIIPWLTTIITNFPQFLLQLFIFISSLYFFLLKRTEFLNLLQKRQLMQDYSLLKLVKLLQRVCYTVVFSTLIVAAVQATIITTAAFICSFDSLFMIFALTFFMSFIPVIGSVPISGSLALFSFLQGSNANGITMLIGLAFAGGVDNIIRTFMLRSKDVESLHPLISLVALIGALSMFGIPGLFLGPIISELAFAIGKILNENQTAIAIADNNQSSSSSSSSDSSSS